MISNNNIPHIRQTTEQNRIDYKPNLQIVSNLQIPKNLKDYHILKC